MDVSWRLYRWIFTTGAALITDYRKEEKSAGTIDDSIEYHGRVGSDIAKEFMKSRIARRFPWFEEEPNVFEGLSFYWKPPKDDDDDDESETWAEISVKYDMVLLYNDHTHSKDISAWQMSADAQDSRSSPRFAKLSIWCRCSGRSWQRHHLKQYQHT